MMAEAGVSIAYRAKPVVRAKVTNAFNYAGLDGVINLFVQDSGGADNVGGALLLQSFHRASDAARAASLIARWIVSG